MVYICSVVLPLVEMVRVEAQVGSEVELTELGEKESGQSCVQPGDSLTAIVTVGVISARLILTSRQGLRQDMARIESRLGGRISLLESQIGNLRSQTAT